MQIDTSLKLEDFSPLTCYDFLNTQTSYPTDNQKRYVVKGVDPANLGADPGRGCAHFFSAPGSLREPASTFSILSLFRESHDCDVSFKARR